MGRRKQPDNVLHFPSTPSEGDGNSLPGTGSGASSLPMSWLRGKYLELRRGGEGVARALQALQVAVDRGLVVGTGEEFSVSGLAAVEGWERLLVAERSAPLLANRAVDLRLRLEDLLRQVEVAKAILEQATNVVDGPPPWGWGANDLWPGERAISEWRSARNDWMRLSSAAAELGERLSREGVERVPDAAYLSRLEDLRSEYSGGGPQYDLLVESVASIDARIRAMDSTARDVPPEEYRQLSELRLKYVAQLQKHRESLKSESVQPVQDAINKLMGELERELKPSNPTAWASIVEATVRAVNKHGLGLDIAS